LYSALDAASEPTLRDCLGNELRSDLDDVRACREAYPRDCTLNTALRDVEQSFAARINTVDWVAAGVGVAVGLAKVVDRSLRSNSEPGGQYVDRIRQLESCASTLAQEVERKLTNCRHSVLLSAELTDKFVKEILGHVWVTLLHVPQKHFHFNRPHPSLSEQPSSRDLAAFKDLS
jgi:hypothetical protein